MNEKTRAPCVISQWLPALCVAHIIPSFGFPLPPHSLWTPVPSPVPYHSPFGLAVHLYSGLCPRWPPQHSPCNIQQKSLSLRLNPFVACVCVCVGCGFVYNRGVCGSFYLKELLKLVWQERQCNADHPVSVISHLRCSAESKDVSLWFQSPLLYPWSISGCIFYLSEQNGSKAASVWCIDTDCVN